MLQSNIHELIERCQKQDERAQFALYEMYKGRMKGLCRRYARSDEDAEDILQEGFVQVFRSLPSLLNINTLGAWMRQIFVRTAINYYNKHLKNYDYVGDAPLMFETTNDHQLILSELSKEELLQVIKKLPDGFRVVFNMYAIDGFSHAEIASHLGITESTSKSQYSRAKEWLRKRLAEEGIVRY
jgi:RNA polymerase sigma factor (sigma-70 family)